MTNNYDKNYDKEYFELRRRIQEMVLQEYSLEEIGKMMDGKRAGPSGCGDELEELIKKFNEDINSKR